ncbi:MAG TPA: hypothetical protein DCG85_01120 [Lachnospiraceae bacterium]|nr:hypothetical protein [Lachnospiraceae bacterium]
MKKMRNYVNLILLSVFVMFGALFVKYDNVFAESISENEALSAENGEEEENALSDEHKRLADQILSGIGSDWTEVEKALYIHDYLVTHIVYDDTKTKHGLADAFNGSAVCSGYSKAFRYLGKRAGLNVGNVKSNRMNHEWNYIILDGKLYYIDCTFDDPEYNGSYHAAGWASHTEFLKSLEGFSHYHFYPESWEFDDLELYSEAANDRRYDNAVWNNSYAPVACLGSGRLIAVLQRGKVVTFNVGGNANEIAKIGDYEEKRFGGEDITGNNGLAFKDGRVFVSDYYSIYEVNTGNGSVNAIFTLSDDKKAKGNIYGILFDANGLRYDIQRNESVSSFVESGYADLNGGGSGVSTGQVRAFVQRLYVEILGRQGEESGINDWTNKLINGEQTGAEVARGFIMSTEFTNQGVSNDVYVRKLYRTFFDREADEGGYNGWINQLNSGTSRYNVLRGFTNSEEFGNLCNRFGITRGSLAEGENDPSPAQQPATDESLLRVYSDGVDRAQIVSYVERIYRKILKREPDDGGLNYWVDAIMNGQSADGIKYDPATVIRTGFFRSDEYKAKNRSRDEFISDVYLAFFDRDPDGDGFSYWQQMLASGGYNNDTMIGTGFGHSREFIALLRSYGFRVEE